MNIKELEKVVQTGLKEILEVEASLPKSRELLEYILETITDTVAKGEKVSIYGFGDFESKERSARKGRNPQTGEELQIEATTVPKFKPAKAFKDKVKAK